MEIVLGKTAGFCYGVKNAVSNAEDKLKEYNNMYCLGELVHNGQVIKKLENLGLKIVDKIEDADNKVIIRAHGIANDVYEKAQNLNIELFDYTCPKVLKIHKIAEEYSKKGYYIFLIGGKNHPESIGTISFCGNESALIETEEQIDAEFEKFKESGIKKLLIIVQTTFSLQKFYDFVDIIKSKSSNDIEIEVKNTICNSTKIRQEETASISKSVDYMIIIGGKNSSNTKKLYDIAKENCEHTVIIETKEELNISEVKMFNKVGIMAGASTPNESIQDVIDELQK